MKPLLAAALALACALAGPAFAATLQADPGSLRSVYDAAVLGDTIQLATGSYGDVSFATYPQSKVFAAPGVVIMPAPGAAPVFASINLSNGAGGVTLQDFEVASTGAGSAVAIAHGDAPKAGGEVHLKRMRIHGPERADHAYTGSGVFVRGDGPGVSIEDSEISNFGLGVGIMDSVGVTVSGSHIHHVQVDGIDINGSADVTIDNNDFDHFYAADGDHPDAIQSWGTADHPRVTNLTVTRNRIVGSTGGVLPPQGIFLDSVDAAKVQGNALVGTLYNGISLSDSHTALIDGNFLQSAPWGGDASTFTRIIVRGQSSDVTVSNNLASSWGQYQDGGQPNPGYAESGNTVIAATTRAADGTPNTADFLKWIAAQGQTAPPVVTPPPVDPPPVVTPPPVVIPPVVNPLQATVDSLTTQVATLTAKVASLTAQLQTATALTQSQASQITTLKAQLAAATGKITKGRAALK